MDRQRIVREGVRTFALVVEESVLRYRIGGSETMGDQLRHLRSLATLPGVSLGVIPHAVDRTALRPVESFWIYDEAQVGVELVSAFLTITQPREISLYAQTFGMLSDQAVYGADARALIASALDSLG
ncbi:hypothetical protein Lfu02_16960 [Longispora fulva]|uniref:DUF5753 domain-containing protein n=2 Tax=Longispora fulva TaxID=619741 RepID=A0A8J7GY59_9ACTN|nr:hypothetical protein [Longispora fulva]GIG57324.1 hypothetical protein Lfu02_16960 [Longispora fulva]